MPPNMASQRTRRPRSGRSLRSHGSPLNARPLGGPDKDVGVRELREVLPPAVTR